MSFEYRPLHPRPSTVRLTLHSLELGHFHYDLSLRALPAPPEKIVHFSAALGRSHMEAIKFINYSHVKAEYSCWVSFSVVFPSSDQRDLGLSGSRMWPDSPGGGTLEGRSFVCTG